MSTPALGSARCDTGGSNKTGHDNRPAMVTSFNVVKSGNSRLRRSLSTSRSTFLIAHKIAYFRGELAESDHFLDPVPTQRLGLTLDKVPQIERPLAHQNVKWNRCRAI